MKTRQQKWLEKGYTQEQINSHLEFERHKAKKSRERRKANNEKNQEKINNIKKDLLDITFKFKHKQITVLKISPTVDGEGVWIKYFAEYSDGSKGEHREFHHFDTYSLDDFVNYLRF